MSPVRVQRKRTKGWRMPEGAVYVGRPTKWGNPYVVGAVLCDRTAYDDNGRVRDRQHAVDLYRRWIEGATGGLRTSFGPTSSAFLTMGDPRDLAGRDLACWCPVDQPCHADVLLDLANGTPS